MLHDIPVKSYCGPAALMAVTGKELAPVRAAINKAKGRPLNTGIIGTSVTEMAYALRELGYTYEAWRYWNSKTPRLAVPYTVDMKKPTVAWLCKNLKPDAVFIMNPTGHWIAVHNGMIYDNWSRYGEHYTENRWKNKRVDCAFSVKGN